MEYPGHHTGEIVPTQLARQPRDQIPIAHLGLREEEEGGLPLLRHPATPVVKCFASPSQPVLQSI